MKFIQNLNYQNIDGTGRDCNERWNIIDKFILKDDNSLSIDIGSAEGFFSKKICNKTKGKVISIEASQHVVSRQQEYCKKEIKNGSIILQTSPLNKNNLVNYTSTRYNYCLLLSVLHWFDDPVLILKEFSKISTTLFLELPELDDCNSWNQNFLIQIKNEHTDIENFLTSNTNKKIVEKFKVLSHTSPFRQLFVLK